MENQTSYAHLDDHLRDEAKFADSEYAPWAGDLAVQEQMFRKYSAPSDMWDWRQFAVRLLGDVSGKRMLDYGCGKGEEATYFAKLGAKVTAFDISEIGVRIANERAKFNGVGDRVDARIMRAEDTVQFPDQSFDIVHGLGILHHVDLDFAMKEVKRLLVPGGAAIFLEPMGNSPTVERIKEWLMERSSTFTHVTEHEENLKLASVRPYASQFAKLDLYPYHLLYRAKKLFPMPVRDALRRIDKNILDRVPQLEWFAGAVVVHIVR